MRESRYCIWLAAALTLIATSAVAGTNSSRGEVEFAKIAALMQAKQPLRSVIELLGTPTAAFMPDQQIEATGFAGRPGEVAFRYEITLQLGTPRKMDVWVVFSARGCTIARIVLSLLPDEKNLPSKGEITALVGHPQRIAHTKWLGSPEDEDLEMAKCNDPGGNIEVWLYEGGLEVTFFDDREAGKGVHFLFLSSNSIKKEYPDCKK